MLSDMDVSLASLPRGLLSMDSGDASVGDRDGGSGGKLGTLRPLKRPRLAMAFVQRSGVQYPGQTIFL